jgi:transposase InsO family protein
MRAFNFRIYHIPGEQNVAADLLSRWGIGAGIEGAAARRVTSAAQAEAIFDAFDAVRFDKNDAPSLSEIASAQLSEVTGDTERDLLLTKGTDGVWRTSDGLVYVPARRMLRVRLCVCAHQGRGGHHGVASTLGWLKKDFWWPKMREDVAAFCAACVVCGKTSGAFTVPRPMGATMFATAPNQVIHFDYTYVRAATPDTLGGYEQVLVLVDGYSRYVEMVPTASPDADTVVMALLAWFSRFGVVRRWVSDQGSHFMNGVMDRMRVMTNAEHHFTAAYAPWSNGRVERVNRELRETLSAVMLEGKVRDDEWPYVLPTVVNIVNNTPTPTLAGYAPITVHTGAEPTSPLAVVFRRKEMNLTSVNVSVDDIRAHVERLQEELRVIHDRVHAQKPVKRAKRPGEVEIDFGVGDYVLVARRGTGVKDKVRPVWEGPAQVIREVRKMVYEVKDLGNDVVQVVHAAHLKRYADAELVVTPELQGIAAHGGQGYLVDVIREYRCVADKWDLLVQWQGLPEEETSWEPAARLFKDVPLEVRKYLKLMPAKDRVGLASHLGIATAVRVGK